MIPINETMLIFSSIIDIMIVNNYDNKLGHLYIQYQ